MYFKRVLILEVVFLMILLISCSQNTTTLNTIDLSSIPDLPYNIVTTNQTLFYDDEGVVSIILDGEAFYGQDANYSSLALAYYDNGDGTITDYNTGLMWTQTTDINGDGIMSSEDKLTYQEAIDSVSSVTTGGYTDWRLPTIKELYSLIIFSGLDINPSDTTSTNMTPFIDTDYFDFYYGLTNEGERIIDSQYLSSTVYQTTVNDDTLVFGVNFADGRIKGYALHMEDGSEKTFSIIYVRGSNTYGINDFIDNEDGTITDRATGLMWMQTGSTDTYTWEEALAYAESFEAAGYSDWRLPTIKELQSIVDYTRSPDATNSPAISSFFSLTSMVNEAGQIDYGFYWSSTTHASILSGGSAAYISFGRSMGKINGNWIDVHGAGAQRSDPKSGNPEDYVDGFGPQGDAIRIYNYVLLVRSS